MEDIHYTERYASHPEDVKTYNTTALRNHFLMDHLFVNNEIHMVYSHFDRFIAGAAVPGTKELLLTSIEPLKADYFLQRRELGIINIGGKGKVITEDGEYEMDYKQALYLGRGNKKVLFASLETHKPAKFYFNSAPAHQTYPDKKVTLKEASVIEAGSLETSNARKINRLIINGVVSTCQLQMGLTELKPGSVWNTMPAHVHSRRMEVYLYFEVPANQAICHYMGQPQETRHLWLKNEEAIISPDWSIHSAAGTSNYNFIWGMAGENLDYSDMDVCQPVQLR